MSFDYSILYKSRTYNIYKFIISYYNCKFLKKFLKLSEITRIVVKNLADLFIYTLTV